MERLLDENLKLIEMIDSIKKQFHGHVNVIYSIAN